MIFLRRLLSRRFLRAALDIERDHPFEHPPGSVGAEWQHFAAGLREIGLSIAP